MAAATLPPLLPRHPLASARLLLRARGWLLGFGAETGGWILYVVELVLAYGLGTLTLQSSFQHGDALTGAGLATLTTNALPIAAGFVLFDEALPGGGAGAMQVAAFACVVLSATAFADPRARDESRHE